MNASQQRLLETPELILFNAANPEQLKKQCKEALEKVESESSNQNFLELISQSLENPIPEENARIGFLSTSVSEPVSYTHLTLPTKA